eukprot:scpid89006/ scgid33529/ 
MVSSTESTRIVIVKVETRADARTAEDHHAKVTYDYEAMTTSIICECCRKPTITEIQDPAAENGSPTWNWLPAIHSSNIRELLFLTSTCFSMLSDHLHNGWTCPHTSHTAAFDPFVQFSLL